MTGTIVQPPPTAVMPKLKLHYQVAMSEPLTHLFEITLTLQNWQADKVNLKLPVWTPGSYLVREYAKQLQDFRAEDGNGSSLPWQKLSKNHWQIQTPDTTVITVHYRLFAHELTVRTNHLDTTHGYFNPGATLMYVPGWEHTPITLTVTPPNDTWQVTTPLPPVPDSPHTFTAMDFDTLVDSPVEIGTHAIYPFEALGKPHKWAIWGQGNFDAERLIADTQKLIQVETDIFGDLPYDRYLFLLHLTEKGYGGLEHKQGCSLQYSRFGFRDPEKYNRFISLVAHEFFHLWNVKRIRPHALETFDYDQENYTDCLWFCEGVTSFYDLVIPVRAGIYDAKWYLKQVSEAITRLQTSLGRLVQSLSESSFDAWIKLYRPDANSKNAQISYYLKGELVSLVLDLWIRQQHQNERSLDDVMRQMWQQFGRSETGYTHAQLQTVIESVAAMDLTDFWHQYIDGTAELPFEEALRPFGLQLQAEIPDQAPPYLGVTLKPNMPIPTVRFVEAGSPAQEAGIMPGDELLAMTAGRSETIVGFRIQRDQLEQRLLDYQPGDAIKLTGFHQDELRTYRVTLGDPVPQTYQIKSVENPTSEQKAACYQWLGADLDTL